MNRGGATAFPGQSSVRQVTAALTLAIARSGKADKAALAVALTRLWPQADVTSSDCCDAAGLAHLGAVRLGWDVPTLQRHRACKAEWPDCLDLTTEPAA